MITTTYLDICSLSGIRTRANTLWESTKQAVLTCSTNLQYLLVVQPSSTYLWYKEAVLTYNYLLPAKRNKCTGSTPCNYLRTEFQNTIQFHKHKRRSWRLSSILNHKTRSKQYLSTQFAAFLANPIRINLSSTFTSEYLSS